MYRNSNFVPIFPIGPNDPKGPDGPISPDGLISPDSPIGQKTVKYKIHLIVHITWDI